MSTEYWSRYVVKCTFLKNIDFYNTLYTIVANTWNFVNYIKIGIAFYVYLAKNSIARSVEPANATRPSAIKIIRSKELNIAELGWCIVHNTVRPCAAKVFNWEIKEFAEWESCPVVGSSKNNIVGSISNWTNLKQWYWYNLYIFIRVLVRFSRSLWGGTLFLMNLNIPDSKNSRIVITFLKFVPCLDSLWSEEYHQSIDTNIMKIR